MAISPTILRAMTALIVLSASQILWAAGDSGQSDRFAIHVLTMGPGDDLFSKFGHISFLVEDRKAQTEKVYNFGTFDFDDPDLKFKYARGFLTFWLSVASFDQTIRRYTELDRQLDVQTLDLSPEQKASIARRLAVNARKENREYAYRHYLDNCCTRIRDIIDETTGGALSRGRNTEPTGRTFRYWTRKALTGQYILPVLILFSLGPAVDRPITRWEEEFLPEVVAKDLDEVTIGPTKRPLVSHRITLVKRFGPPPGAEQVPWPDLAAAIFLFSSLILGFGLGIVLKKSRIGARFFGAALSVWGLAAGLGGLLLLLFWTITEHTDTYYNENFLIMPVFHLWLLGPGMKLLFKARVKERTGRILGYYFLAALMLVFLDMALKLGPFVQDNWEFIAFSAACDLAALATLVRRGLFSIPKISL